MDSDTGLLHYRARVYDPEMGTFISEDPIGLEGGVNLYSYVENDPVNGTDRFGLKRKKTRDKWYGRDDKDFRRWFHRCWKQGGDPDASKEDIEEAYEEWLSRGSPQGGECWGAKKPAPSQCRQPAFDPKRVLRPTMDELRLEEFRHRQMEIFWKKVLGGSIIGGGIIVGGPTVIAPAVRILIRTLRNPGPGLSPGPLVPVPAAP